MALRAIAARLPARARAMGHLASLDFDPLTVGQLTRVQLLELAKNHGQNTNMPSSEIVAALKRIYMMRSADQSFIDTRDVKEAPSAPFDVPLSRMDWVDMDKMGAAGTTPSRAFVSVELDGKPYKVPAHYSVLQAFRNMSKVKLPTLCDHPRLKSVGTCRLCLVEARAGHEVPWADVPAGAALLHLGIVQADGGESKNVAACVTRVAEGMSYTSDSKAINDSVTNILRSMLSKHPNACMTCEVDGQCEFQDLVRKFGIDGEWPKAVEFKHQYDDHTDDAIYREMDKCVHCGRCVRMCSVVQRMDVLGRVGRGEDVVEGTGFLLPLHDSACIECGQCAVICPTGAIIEVPKYHEILNRLEHKGRSEKVFIASFAPSCRVSYGEEIGKPAGTNSEGEMITLLRGLGFDYVLDTNFAADLTIMEEGHELLERVKKGGPFPMFTSCCPGWVNFVEKGFPEYIPHLSTCRSPQTMMGSMVKTYFAKKIGRKPEDLILVSMMPCTAKKHEAARPEFKTDDGLWESDYSITTREFAKMVRAAKLPTNGIEKGKFDPFMGSSTGAAIIFGATGGVLEAALRTGYAVATGKMLPDLNLTMVRGMKGVRSATVDLNGFQLKVAVTHGTANIRELLARIAKQNAERGHGFDGTGEYDHHFIEVMACPGGCIGGAGQPKSLDPDVLVKRMQAIYSSDEAAAVRASHENPEIQTIYKEFLGAPLGHLSHKLLHTHYHDHSKYGDHGFTESTSE